ncbi:MAG TPA: complex I subunit 1 family protein, partial [Tepidisphaeraceae bacterium]|nr:complex I subunit 1 family protein [Tepidisphaeraceae bacterium]
IPWGGTKINHEMIVMPASATSAQLNQAAVNAIPWWGHVMTQPVKTNAAYLNAGDQAYSFTWGWLFQIAQLNIGVLFILAALSLAVYGVVIGGWASNNKYSFLGGLRATANMISYEIPLGLAVLTIVAMFGTLDLGSIVDKQIHYWWGFIPAWNCFCQPAAFLMFLVCIHAEANRAPFDLAEAEQELVGGYHTEYSAMRFALFFLGEYAGMITTSAVCVALFFGGWHIPWLDMIWPELSKSAGHIGWCSSLGICVLRALCFFGKTIFVLFVFMWVRWSLPRYRFDQLMMLAWRALIPMSLALLTATTLVLFFFAGSDPLYAASGPGQLSFLISDRMFLILLGMNVGTVILIMLGSMIVPAAPPTNRKMPVPDSRFQHTPVAAGSPAV